MKNFTNKNVLITGASMGIGAEFARQLAAQKANLLLTARSTARLQNLAEQLTQEFAVQVRVYPQDLAAPGAAQKLFDRIQQEQVPVDVLINNAGFGKWGYFEEYDASVYAEMINLNVRALVELTRLFVSQMLANGEGAILNVASNAGFQPVAFLNVYAATKAFVLSFSEALWAEYRHRGIAVTALCPGATVSNFHAVANANSEIVKKFDPVEMVVAKGLQALLAGKPSVVTGWLNWVAARSTRLFTRRFLAKLTYRMFRPKSAADPSGQHR